MAPDDLCAIVAVQTSLIDIVKHLDNLTSRITMEHVDVRVENTSETRYIPINIEE